MYTVSLYGKCNYIWEFLKTGFSPLRCFHPLFEFWSWNFFSKVGYIGSRRFAHLLLYISIIMKKLLMHVPRFYTFQYVECTVYRYSLYALLVFGPTLHQSVLVYTVTPKSGKGSFLNIENLWVYYSNLKVFLAKHCFWQCMIRYDVCGFNNKEILLLKAL